MRDVNIAGASEYEALSKEERGVIRDTDMKVAIDKYLSSLNESMKCQ